jgi:hypothetical protein
MVRIAYECEYICPKFQDGGWKTCGFYVNDGECYIKIMIRRQTEPRVYGR